MPDDTHYDIFISYARADGRVHADRLEKALTEAGFTTWRDVRNIDPALDFTADIETGIEQSSIVVVCVTEDSRRVRQLCTPCRSNSRCCLASRYSTAFR